MAPRKTLGMIVAAAALVAGQFAVGNASAAPAQASPLQQKVDTFLEQHPEARQTSRNTVDFPGGSATIAEPGATVDRTRAPACDNGWLCVQVANGTIYRYYTCQLYQFRGTGDGTFNNNQSSGTVARFYNQNGTQRWTNTAKDTGTASWTPVWSIRPC
ncbi:hypothetical protein [Streptomyces clavuligerus]|uniref:Secreted protein n=1 Tax=Streptomyces clavuligerus TaxID=1901 RepID=B5GMX0_STRCL|nr:hypothetical protein [Streptomyces clavuligerus]ANW22271.1 hypothetical protein BB341_28475 [Streptomyces clavuligerus]AXU17166.1 hypothetical protein D1794_31550 [Streptomyces clavuligerus]EDY47666.1 secreted protein [Streptomyces clavuligerus]EFG04340.1 secreted protein [Streptomyces clavuligerus]MBY6307188.1 hypothetical protein [Streptomyces clavuligerus]